jgi:membrane protease YdiL (CAAX protease family)
MPPPSKGTDKLRPLLAAGTCAFFFYFAYNMLVAALRFVAGDIVAITVTELIAALIANSLAFAIYESGALADLGLHWNGGSARNLGLGIGLGAVAASLVVLAPVGMGIAHFTAVPNADVSAGAVMFTPLLLLAGALGEEIAFRGYVLQSLMRGYGAWAAIFATGALFGVMHLGNPGATILSTVNTAAFGILFGAAIQRSRDLWLAAGMHFGWNAVLPFLGVELSGLTIRVTRFKLVWSAGNLWSGGEYGPEASVLTTLVLVLLAVAVWKVPVNRAHRWFGDGLNEAELLEPQL